MKHAERERLHNRALRVLALASGEAAEGHYVSAAVLASIAVTHLCKIPGVAEEAIALARAKRREARA